MQKQKSLICVVGQTASGKSALALRIAKEWNGEIICADSWTIRRDVNIGTAKPSAKDRRLIPHHLLDIVGPNEDFNAALFKSLALRAIADISARGKLAIMVGGTGLYVDSVIYDYSFAPTGNHEAREQLNVLTLHQLMEKIHKDGLELGTVDVRNKRRLIRLIESNGAKPSKKNLRSQTLLIGLYIEKGELTERITKRLDAMIKAGLESEVRLLSQQYGWDCEALQGIGYAQWHEHFLGRESRDEVRQKIIRATLNLAKRQQTWFQRNKSIQWLDTPVKWHEVVDLVTTYMDDNISK